MSNIINLDRHRPITTISEARVDTAIDWRPPKYDPSPIKAILDTLVLARQALHKLERAGMKTGPMTLIIVALEDAHDQAEKESE